MKDFNFKIPQNIQFGMGSLKKLPEILAENHSDNILLVSDRGLEKIGVVKKVQDIIEAAGLKCTSYLDVVPNPTVAVVNEATARYKECGATSIVALGGGSSMDVGKAVGVLVNYGGKITDYEGNHKVPGPIVPMIAIPTTAGTGSEVTASAVITDTERNYKLSVFSYEILPKYAVLDPELIMTAPASIAASCGVDALIHAMSHPVSAYFNVPHGVANSILLPNVVEYNALADHGRYEVIYNYIREGNGPIENFTPDMLVEELRHLNEQLGIPATLSEVGVTADKIPAMAEDAMKSGNIPANPRQSTVKDIIKLYEKTM